MKGKRTRVVRIRRYPGSSTGNPALWDLIADSQLLLISNYLVGDGTVGDVKDEGVPAASIEAASLAMVELTLQALSTASQLSVLQVRVLLSVDRNERLNLSDLAADLQLSKPFASRLVTRLVDDGLLLRRPHPHDRRQLLLTLSARGRRALDRLRGARQSGLSDVLAAMPPEARDALSTGMASFAEAAQRISGAQATEPRA
ncbi:MarR family winged helix-turn-helix transcriptional regulator [Kribbella sp. NPDC059898]|uniref:MarR family winged helix-turn-helix transcriptional regulator n=1 Tax=Kribbella sp. NPDC059898 TaxID=3346995 RepID=UPI0036478A32